MSELWWLMWVMVAIMPLSTRHRAPVSRSSCPPMLRSRTMRSPTWKPRPRTIEGRSGEVTGFGGVLAGEGVEEFGFGTGAGEQVGGSTGGVSVPPVGNGPVADVVGGVGEDDSIVLGVGVPEGGDVTVAEVVERGVFPLVALASVDREFAGAVAERVERGSESAASGDLGKLVVIADEDHLRSGCVGAGDDLVEVDGAAHAGFVDDHDRVRVEVVHVCRSGGW